MCSIRCRVAAHRAAQPQPKPPCTFCGRRFDDFLMLIAAPDNVAHICDQCVDSHKTIVEKQRQQWEEAQSRSRRQTPGDHS
jgi:ATP-dependent protease Clp ATPase subunit